MLEITQVGFGAMTIGNRRFRSDLVIYPDGRIEGGWRRRRGHHLSAGDIQRLLDSRPQVLVVGSGVFGRMKPAEDLKEASAARDIALHVLPTKRAAERFNALVKAGKRAGGCFHLTC